MAKIPYKEAMERKRKHYCNTRAQITAEREKCTRKYLHAKPKLRNLRNFDNLNRRECPKKIM